MVWGAPRETTRRAQAYWFRDGEDFLNYREPKINGAIDPINLCSLENSLGCGRRTTGAQASRLQTAFARRQGKRGRLRSSHSLTFLALGGRATHKYLIIGVIMTIMAAVAGRALSQST